MAHIAPESPVLGEALERRAMLLRARNSHTRLLVSLLLALASLYEANHSVLLRTFVHKFAFAALGAAHAPSVYLSVSSYVCVGGF